ncbi:hypothetical protein [Burkholderia gladioli]|uniref:hypothetical protein n=1 Tax=Burkholderia gladioli TaxID=28095 RepID=UPI00163F63BC|nr:hypothetical protein [Burkholderia gladioli]
MSLLATIERLERLTKAGSLPPTRLGRSPREGGFDWPCAVLTIVLSALIRRYRLNVEFSFEDVEPTTDLYSRVFHFGAHGSAWFVALTEGDGWHLGASPVATLDEMEKTPLFHCETVQEAAFEMLNPLMFRPVQIRQLNLRRPRHQRPGLRELRTAYAAPQCFRGVRAWAVKTATFRQKSWRGRKAPAFPRGVAQDSRPVDPGLKLSAGNKTICAAR